MTAISEAFCGATTRLEQAGDIAQAQRGGDTTDPEQLWELGELALVESLRALAHRECRDAFLSSQGEEAGPSREGDEGSLPCDFSVDSTPAQLACVALVEFEDPTPRIPGLSFPVNLFPADSGRSPDDAARSFARGRSDVEVIGGSVVIGTGVALERSFVDRLLESLRRRRLSDYYRSEPRPSRTLQPENHQRILELAEDVLGPEFSFERLLEACTEASPSPEARDPRSSAECSSEAFKAPDASHPIAQNCAAADLYFSPAGELYVRGVRWPSTLAVDTSDLLSVIVDRNPTRGLLQFSVCVDFLEAQPFQPLAVEFRTRDHVATLEAFPGIRTIVPPRLAREMDLRRFAHADILTVTVRGSPADWAVQNLAVRNRLLATTPPPRRDAAAGETPLTELASFASLLREHSRIVARADARARQRGDFRMRAALAISIRQDEEVQRLVARIRSLAPSVGPVRGRAQATFQGAWSELTTLLDKLIHQSRLHGAAASRVADFAQQELVRIMPMSPRLTQADDPLEFFEGWLERLIAPSEGDQQEVEREERRREELSRVVELLCELGSLPVRLVQHELVTDQSGRIAVYDYEEGYQPFPAPREDGVSIDDSHPFYVVVQRVPVERTVLVALDGSPLETGSTRLLGVPGQASDNHVLTLPGYTYDDAQLDRLRQQVALPGTQVVNAGRLSGSHDYTLHVCERTGNGQGSSTCGSDARTIGRHALRVAGRHRVGVRAGPGVAYRPGSELRFERLAPDAEDWLLVNTPREPAFTLPVELVVYLLHGGRDVFAFDYQGPVRDGFNLAFTVGLDAIDPLRRWFPLGLTVDLWGFGLSFSLMLERAATPIGGFPGQRISATQRPEVEQVFATRDELLCGLNFGITFDFDVFQRLVLLIFDNKSGLGQIRPGG